MTGGHGPDGTPAASSADQSLRWLARLRSGDVTPAERAAFADWCRQDPGHRREFDRAEALWRAMEGLRPLYAPRRRRPWASLGAAAAGLAAVTVLAIGVSNGWSSPRLMSHPYVTAKAERRDIALDDGSMLHMNADTVVIEEPCLWTRSYRLERGEAVFDVVHNSRRPFQVAVDQAVVRDVGTRFDIWRDAHGAGVSVFEGAVDLIPAPDTPVHALASGQAARVGSGGVLSLLEPADEQTRTAWRHGQFIFDALPLGEVVDELNRYGRDPIVIPDPAIAALRISGSFDTGNIDGILRTLERVVPVSARRDGTAHQILLLAREKR